MDQLPFDLERERERKKEREKERERLYLEIVFITGGPGRGPVTDFAIPILLSDGHAWSLPPPRKKMHLIIRVVKRADTSTCT